MRKGRLLRLKHGAPEGRKGSDEAWLLVNLLDGQMEVFRRVSGLRETVLHKLNLLRFR